jgi:hypothetical protein
MAEADRPKLIGITDGPCSPRHQGPFHEPAGCRRDQGLYLEYQRSGWAGSSRLATCAGPRSTTNRCLQSLPQPGAVLVTNRRSRSPFNVTE